jgi:hypothetical protein
MLCRPLVVLCACAAFAALGAVPTEQKGQPSDRGSTAGEGHIVLAPDQLKWGPAPAGLPPGARMAVLEGDPGKEGMFTLRAKLPAGYKIPPHWHSIDEHITVLSGTFAIGDGDRFEKAAATKLAAGGYTAMPAKMHHFAFCEEETVIQVHGMGPFDITYIHPGDDPRKSRKG